jgi:hypothetical protein
MGTAVWTAAVVARADEGVVVEEAEEEKEWSVSAGFDLWSEYIFRGVRIADNDPLYSPSASFAWKGLSLWYWGGYGDSEGPDDTYEENDFGADYTLTFFDDKLSITGGGLMYEYPDGNSGADTYEVYGKAAYDILLQPNVALYWDIDEFHGGYLTFGIGHSFDLGPLVELKEPMAWSLDPSAALSVDLGYNDRSTDSNVALNDLLFGVRTSFTVTEHIELHTGIQYSVALDSLANAGLANNHLIGNVGVGFSF